MSIELQFHLFLISCPSPETVSFAVCHQFSVNFNFLDQEQAYETVMIEAEESKYAEILIKFG